MLLLLTPVHKVTKMLQRPVKPAVQNKTVANVCDKDKLTKPIHPETLPFLPRWFLLV